MVADVIVVMEEAAAVLSGSSLSFAAVATMVLADLATAVVMTVDVSSGSYLSFAAVVATMVSADVEIPAVNEFVNLINGVANQRRFFYYIKSLKNRENVVAFLYLSSQILYILQKIS